MTEQNISVEQLNILRQQHLGRLLLRAYRAFSTQTIEELRLRGYVELAPAHTMLLTNIDVHGTRITNLAEQIGVSRQAVSTLVHYLEQHGYVTRSVDTTDRRAFIVTLTDEGWRLLADIVDIKMKIEANYSASLGVEQVQMLRSGLMKLVDHIDVSDVVRDISDSI